MTFIPNTDSSDLPPAEPMTFSLLGKFFGVPLMIIASIVGGAVVVVLLFGGPASPQRRSVESLLQALEADSGQRSMGLLLPREKEPWQAALELSVRLGDKEKEAELADGELRSIAVRLARLVKVDLADIDRHLAADPARSVRSRRLEFLIHALGRTERPEAIEPLLEVLGRRREPYATVAMQELGRLHGMPEARRAIEPIVSMIKTSTKPETQLMACTVLSVLAAPGDREVIDALAVTRLANDGEVAWSAALALARLGSDAGKSTLMDLLDRSFLESGERYRVADTAGKIRWYPLPPQRVDELLMATIDAAARLDDTEVWEMIVKLESDPSPVVRGRATAATSSRRL